MDQLRPSFDSLKTRQRATPTTTAVTRTTGDVTRPLTLTFNVYVTTTYVTLTSRYIARRYAKFARLSQKVIMYLSKEQSFVLETL